MSITKKSYRKQNVTGIKRLSIGETKNAQGHSLRRYSVSIKNEAGKWRCKTYYFGENRSQYEAYLAACAYLKEIDAIAHSDVKLRKIYIEHKHETLL